MGLFSGTSEKINLLKKSQETLEATQKNIEAILERGGCQLPGDSQFSDVEKRQAAYALNLCMVSVSQIIDYDDIYILEQEYDAILNNLNLEMMPKDEALLEILKQLLNTITFFRIQEGDKKFIEKEYQQRVKNAIWAAVPNFAIIGAGGNPLSVGISLATQVGIGYMNYRKEKAQIAAEREKEEWKLQRSAMEQFNGLRRELFDTAWRLADKYNFPDEYRLTESQIARYNTILMDSDYLRRYERLSYISDKFEAYPPFWYSLGNAANVIAQDTSYDPKIQAEYRFLAMQHFQKFLDITERNLLREDKLLASCALEYADLLLSMGNNAPQKLEPLVRKAVSAAGNSYDILEMCGIAYIRLGNYTEAAKILRMLVNEGYNETVNAQFLSRIYVSDFINKALPSAQYDYLTLQARVGKNLLFPMPSNSNLSQDEKSNLQSTFMLHQRNLLTEKYGEVLKSVVTKYESDFEKAVPFPASKGKVASAKYEDNITARHRKYSAICAEIKDERKRSDYLFELEDFADQMFSVLSDFYGAIRDLPGVFDESAVQDEILESIIEQKSTFNAIQEKIIDKTFSNNDVTKLFCLNFTTLVQNSLLSVIRQAHEYISDLQNMADISRIEGELREFCNKYFLPIPDEKNCAVSSAVSSMSGISYFDTTLLCETESEKRRLDMKREMRRCIEEYKDKIVLKGNIYFYVQGSEDFAAYCKRHKDELGEKQEIIAIINDRTPIDRDWIITLNGLKRFARRFSIKKVLDGPFPYENIQISQAGDRLTIDEDEKVIIDNNTLNLKNLHDLISELAKITSDYQDASIDTTGGTGAFPEALGNWVFQQMLDAQTKSIDVISNQTVDIPIVNIFKP